MTYQHVVQYVSFDLHTLFVYCTQSLAALISLQCVLIRSCTPGTGLLYRSPRVAPSLTDRFIAKYPEDSVSPSGLSKQEG